MNTQKSTNNTSRTTFLTPDALQLRVFSPLLSSVRECFDAIISRNEPRIS